MLTREQLDEAAAVVILYHWACGEITTARCKLAVEHCNFRIDYRQADIDNTIAALYVPTGEYKTLEI